MILKEAYRGEGIAQIVVISARMGRTADTELVGSNLGLRPERLLHQRETGGSDHSGQFHGLWASTPNTSLPCPVKLGSKLCRTTVWIPIPGERFSRGQATDRIEPFTAETAE
jgi:hypothetical protein